MDNSISTARPDVVALETAPRPTAPPVRVPFSEILSSSALALVEGAQAAARAPPGGTCSRPRPFAEEGSEPPRSERHRRARQRRKGLPARSSAAGMLPVGGTTGTGAGLLPTSTSGGDGTIDASLAQSQQLNLYYLQIQQQVNDQNRTFTLLSNVIEMEHNTAKSAIGNIH